MDDLISGDDERAEQAVPRLAACGDDAVNMLLSLLETDNPDHRWWATRALAACPQPAAQRGLCQSLEDRRDSAVRYCAATALRHQPCIEALPLLIDALQEDDRLLARLAADALISLGQDAIPALVEASQSEQPAVRIEAVRALAKMRHPQTIPALFQAAEDSSSIVVHWAEQGLDDLGVGMIFFEP
ncbi:MAG: HEAT repeat domain-containing protein [Anaerolineales bacterium]